MSRHWPLGRAPWTVGQFVQWVLVEETRFKKTGLAEGLVGLRPLDTLGTGDWNRRQETADDWLESVERLGH